jgi:hypothetical protein
MPSRAAPRKAAGFAGHDPGYQTAGAADGASVESVGALSAGLQIGGGVAMALPDYRYRIIAGSYMIDLTASY